MAQEIDQFLMDQFCSGLEGVGNSGSKIPLHNQFEEIRILLEKNQKIIKSSWLAETSSKRVETREKLHYLNNVLTECQMLSWKNQVTLFNIKRKLINITGKLRGWVANETTSAQPNGEASSSNETNSAQPNGGASSSNGRQVTRWSSQVVDAAKVHGFDNEVISLEKLLLGQGSGDLFKAIGIIGKAGIGKTTLCQVIFNKPEVQNYFLRRIWVCMSIKPDEDQDTRVAIIKRMLEYLGVVCIYSFTSKTPVTRYVNLRSKHYSTLKAIRALSTCARRSISSALILPRESRYFMRPTFEKLWTREFTVSMVL